MLYKRTQIILIIGLSLQAFLLWLWIYHQHSLALQNEWKRGQSLARDLAALNEAALKLDADPLISLYDLDKEKGVVDIVVTDKGEKILAPLAQFGETFDLKIFNGKILKHPILGFDQSLLGEAIIGFKPDLPNFLWLWPIFAISLFVIPAKAGIQFFQKVMDPDLRRDDILRSAPISFDWLKGIASFLQKSLIVFDEEGNIVSTSFKISAKHILDLFQNAAQAQDVLNAWHDLKVDAENRILEITASMKLGFWRSDNGTKYYILACDAHHFLEGI